jgi:hypothetical protein
VSLLLLLLLRHLLLLHLLLLLLSRQSPSVSVLRVSAPQLKMVMLVVVAIAETGLVLMMVVTM